MKLVRDRVVERISKDTGRIPRHHNIGGDELLRELKRKLIEEACEVFGASPESLPSEMADVLEVLRGIAERENLPWESVERAAIAKRLSHGGFERGIVLE